MNIVKLFQKRPSDKAIKLTRIWIWLFYILLLSLTFYVFDINIENSYFGQILTELQVKITKIVLVSMWILPILVWLFDITILKSKFCRIIHIIIAIGLFILPGIVQVPLDGKIIPTDFMFIIALFALFSWITWKFITKKWLRFGQKVTKIRV